MVHAEVVHGQVLWQTRATNSKLTFLAARSAPRTVQVVLRDTRARGHLCDHKTGPPAYCGTGPLTRMRQIQAHKVHAHRKLFVVFTTEQELSSYHRPVWLQSLKYFPRGSLQSAPPTSGVGHRRLRTARASPPQGEPALRCPLCPAILGAQQLLCLELSPSHHLAGSFLSPTSPQKRLTINPHMRTYAHTRP